MILGITQDGEVCRIATSVAERAPQLSSEDRVYVNTGGVIITAAPTGLAGLIVARLQLLQADPVAESLTSKLGKPWRVHWRRVPDRFNDC